uniref:Ig-like domain-containing protein n=1 Tax=Myotis lucifugus TaxID=59463 RepID=G1QDY7_MYOLU
MDSLSAPICRGPIPWQGLLLAVSLLNFWSLPTTAEFVVLSKNAVEGRTVMLRTRDVPPGVTAFYWYKGRETYNKNMIGRLTKLIGRQRTGPAYSGREYIYFDGTLVINTVTQKDTGFYTLVVNLPNKKQEKITPNGELIYLYCRTKLPAVIISQCWEHPDLPLRPWGINSNFCIWGNGQCSPVTCSVELPTLNITSINFQYKVTKTGFGHLYCLVPSPLSISHALYFFTEPVRVPTLQASNTRVMEHKDSVVLTCHTNAVSTQWFFNGMNLLLTERMKLSSNDRSLTIDPVSREDAGIYQCEVSNPISWATSVPVKLDVKY